MYQKGKDFLTIGIRKVTTMIIEWQRNYSAAVFQIFGVCSILPIIVVLVNTVLHCIE